MLCVCGFEQLTTGIVCFNWFGVGWAFSVPVVVFVAASVLFVFCFSLVWVGLPYSVVLLDVYLAVV